MKTLLFISFVVTDLIGQCLAGTSTLPEIPAPKLSVPQVLGIVHQQMQNSTNYMVVGIDWYQASAFQPRIGDARYSPAGDDPNDYSWFVTFVYKDEQTEKRRGELGIKRQFNSAVVLRIKDDGKIGKFVGVQ